MLTFEEAKEKTMNFSVPCYEEPVLIEEDQDFIYYRIKIPKILIKAACEKTDVSGCVDNGSCCGCG